MAENTMSWLMAASGSTGGGGGGGGLPITGGTMSGPINMDGNAITNLPQASASGDAVSYGQVSQMISDENSLFADNSFPIRAGTDLNSVTAAGTYYVPNISTAQSLSNCPISAGFRLFVIETTATNRLYQILLANVAASFVYKRYYNGTTWSDWQRIVNNTESLISTSATATATNYMSIFPSGSFNDALPNSVIGISSGVPLADGPDGDAWTGAPGRPRGTISGTLITTTQAANPSVKSSGLAQLLIGYRDTSYKPTFSYRIATVQNNAYTWSNWSKFEENGYLHATNVMLYNGTEDGQSTLILDDLNNAEPNSIYQIDPNCTEGVVAHNPCPGVSSVLMCYAFSYTTRHGMVQTLYNVYNEMYYRYGYINNANDYIWTPWVKVNTSVPAAPTTDGAYVLQCTVSSGVATYTWVSAT